MQQGSEKTSPGSLADPSTQVRTATAAHTPGPWSFDTISMETGDYGVSQRDLRISICHVHNAASFGDFIAGAMKRGGGRFEQSDAVTQLANARLIAAAPDMLAALDRLTNAAAGFTTGYSTELTAAFHQAHGALRSAVGDRDTRATGTAGARTK